ncbi:11959_t:CDS:2 [Racocetra fulgida]|uniref:11959_t:CDS:1 n=1 Tax=Racocetra fulgida TaxID=60492 RepID=A0A9N9F5C6_9GLOM|nr:11959_t:CDS:2 [Racocetra fulgida]
MPASAAVPEPRSVKEVTAKKSSLKIPPKPDEEAYKKALEEVNTTIDKLQQDLNDVVEKINNSPDNAPVSQRREELRAQLDRLRGKQAEMKKKRHQKVEQLKKKQVESGTLKIVDEKRIISDISGLKKSRKVVETFETQQAAIDAEQKSIDEMRKDLEDNEFKEANAQYDKIKAELETISKDQAMDREKRNELFDEKKRIREQINTQFANRRTIQDEYNKAKQEYWQRVDEDQEASIPAFQEDIQICENLIYYFQTHHGVGKTEEVVSSNDSSQPDTTSNIRQPDTTSNVPEGCVSLAKKFEDDDDLFGGKLSKKVKSQKKKKPNKTNGFQLPLSIMDQLILVKVAIPLSPSDVEKVVNDLTEKKDYFVKNQDRITKENIAKAEEEIAALEGKGHNKKVDDEKLNEKNSSEVVEESSELNNEVKGECATEKAAIGQPNEES